MCSYLPDELSSETERFLMPFQREILELKKENEALKEKLKEYESDSNQDL